MPSRPDVWLVGKAPVLEFHTCMLRLSHISRFCKAQNNGVSVIIGISLVGGFARVREVSRHGYVS
jgi:hypothetical protein